MTTYESGFRFKRVDVDALSPSEVRSRVLAEHAMLRERLVELQSLARAVTIEQTIVGELRQCVRKLIMEFSMHLESEEEILMPVIETIDAWGHQRASRMRDEHALQRALLVRMFERVSSPQPPIELAIEADALALRVFRDMLDEEQGLLAEDFLRDDVVAIDQFCG